MMPTDHYSCKALLDLIPFFFRRKIQKDVENFKNLSRQTTDRKCAEAIAEDGLHILINLNGHTAGEKNLSDAHFSVSKVAGATDFCGGDIALKPEHVVMRKCAWIPHRHKYGHRHWRRHNCCRQIVTRPEHFVPQMRIPATQVQAQAQAQAKVQALGVVDKSRPGLTSYFFRMCIQATQATQVWASKKAGETRTQAQTHRRLTEKERRNETDRQNTCRWRKRDTRRRKTYKFTTNPDLRCTRIIRFGVRLSSAWRPTSNSIVCPCAADIDVVGAQRPAPVQLASVVCLEVKKKLLRAFTGALSRERLSSFDIDALSVTCFALLVGRG